MERTLIILKPDAIQRNLVGKIINIFEEKGVKIIAIKMVILDDKRFEVVYADIKGKTYYQQTKDFMQSGPCIAMILAGNGVINKVLKICGTSHLENENPDTIRGRFALWTGCDVIHRSDSIEQAEKSIMALFDVSEIFSYTKIDEKYMSEKSWESYFGKEK